MHDHWFAERVDGPVRSALELGTFEVAGARVVARAHVGDVDLVTDRVPTFGSDCLLLDGGLGGGPPVLHRTDHRRLVPVTWTEVAVVES